MAKSFKTAINNNIDRKKRIKNCGRTQRPRQERIELDEVIINLRSVRSFKDIQEISYY